MKIRLAGGAERSLNSPGKIRDQHAASLPPFPASHRGRALKPERSLATILFTDIVGSTERAAKLRDAGWRDLRQEHDRRVRRELRRFAGHEINTAGDSFLATFEGPARAIACAGAIRAAVRELGLEIRAGLHMGEIERVGHGHDLGGLAVHIGARVAAEAGPGEILVSRSVHDALAGSAFDFEDRGVRALKGVPDEWRLFAVTSIPAEAGETLPGRLARLPLTQRRLLSGGAVAAVALLAGLYIARREAGPALTPEEALAVNAAPGIAVLPFTVNDLALQTWREGMVDLLSTNLDGMGGLRAIDSRTVLARWREITPKGREPDLATTLEVARRTGARYAVLGNAVAIGPDVRLVAEVYDLEGAHKLGQRQVAGAPDSVFALVDRLSIDVVRAILQRGGEELTPIPRLASLTTESLPALKAFLQGESNYRRSEFARAIDAYESAIAVDSTFALALFRLSSAYGWVENIGSEVSRTYLERAARLAGRLPAREAVFVRADLALLRGSIEGLEPLRRSVQRHPDDPEGWYLLGDTYVHLGDQALVDESEVGRVLGRAVALDPTFAPYRIHLVERAVRQSDETHAVRLAAAYGRLAPGTTWDRRNRLAIALVFGNAAARASPRAVIDTVATRVLWGVAGLYLLHPQFLAVQEELLRAVQQRADAPLDAVATRLFFNHYNQGKYRAALAQLDDPSLPRGFEAFGLYALSLEGVALPPARERDALTVAQEDTVPVLNGLFAGAHAADRGRWADHEKAIRRLRGHASRRLAGGDSVSARLGAGAARGLEAYGLLLRGQAEEALPLLEAAEREVTGNEPVPRAANHLLRWWLAGVLSDLGRTAEAVQVLETFWQYPLWNYPQAAYRAGELLAVAGKSDEARRAFDYALLAWRDADPELQPRIEAARRALAQFPGPLKRESR